MNTQSIIETHIEVNEDDSNLIELVVENTQLSRALIKDCMAKGGLWVERNQHVQRCRRAKKNLLKDDVIHFYFDPKILDLKPLPLNLVSDQQQYSVWYKPSGVLSQGSKWSDHCTVARWAEQHLLPERPAFIVHRLDKAANGLILLAHSKKMANQLSQLFENRQITKQYRARVFGEFPTQRVNITESIDNKPAISHVERLKFDSETQTSVVRVDIETGRKHQIRKHLAGYGYPIMGDRLFGNKQLMESDNEMDLQLSSTFLSFVCPIDKMSKEFFIPKQFELN